MSRRSEHLKRVQRGEEAKERVLSGVHNQPKEPYTSTRQRAFAKRRETLSTMPSASSYSSLAGLQTVDDAEMYAKSTIAREQHLKSQNYTGKSQPLQPMVSRTNYKKLGEDISARQEKTERKQAEKKAAQQFIERDRAIRDAQDPKNKFWDFVKDNTVDLVGEGITRLQVNNPVGRFINRFGQSAGSAVGVDTQAAGAAPMLSTGSRIADKSADITGVIGGSLTNPSNIGQGLMSGSMRAGQALAGNKAVQGVVNKTLNKVNPSLNTFGVNISDDLAGRALSGATAGAIQGGVISGVRGETDARELALNVGLGAGLGAAGDVALPLIGKGIQRGVGGLADAVTRKAAERVTGGALNATNAIETVGRESNLLANAKSRLSGIDEELTNLNVRTNKGGTFSDEVSSLQNERIGVVNYIKQYDPEFVPPVSEMVAVPDIPVRPDVPTANVPTSSGSPTVSTRKMALQRSQPNELKFAQTVKNSPNSAPELVTSMNESAPMVGARTSDVLNRQEADKLIQKYGREGLYAKLLSKKMNLSPAESTAAQTLAKHFSSQGGQDNMSKAIELIAKTAREGREMGQAIQALSQWNKLDETGALLLGQRQLNRGISDTAEWKNLTTAQAAPIQEAAQRVGQAQQAKSLADEVLSIVSNKKPGEALTDVDKATIQQFQEQVKTINDKAKPFLPKSKSAVQETIEKVSKTPPKERTRDQVVSLLEAKAQRARERINRSRGVGFAAQDQGNIVADYAIIMSANIAKGIVKYADNVESISRDFGQSAKPHLQKAYSKAVNIYRKENGLPTTEELDRVVSKAIKMNQLDEETAQALKVMANEIGFYTDKNLKLEATQDLQKALKGLGTSTLGQKLSTLQTGAQLLNFVTISRNIIGNAAQMTAEKVNKMAAVPIDWAFSNFTGERTIKFLPHNQENLWRNGMMGTKSGWDGVSPTGTLASYDIHPEVFGNKNPLKYVSKALGASMQGFDFAAYRAAYGDVVATYAEQLGKAQKLSKAQIKAQMPKLIEQLDDRIHEMADKAGLYATFQDETLLSQGAQLLKRGLNKITDVPAEMLVERGLLPKSLSTEGFGLGDIVVKYARTPANLIMRGIDYSPIGIVRSVMEIAPFFINRSKFNQFQATRALSRTITGTLGLTGMGYLLADAGILTGSSSMDKDERSIQEQSGQGAYKVNFSALGRFISSGLDKDAAKYQKGDHMADYAWLQPAAISVAMGVNANKAVKDRKDGEDVTGWQVAHKAILGGLASVLENPMVQGISNVIDAGTEVMRYQKTDKLKGIVKGVPASFVPTLSNQARAATDNNQRETADEDLLTEMGNLVKNKIPGLSKKLPVSYDSLGKPRERIQGGDANTVGQYLTSFFSPARMTKYEVTPEAKLVLDLMNESGDKNVLPRINTRSVEVTNPITQKDESLQLTGAQFSRLQKQVGEDVTQRLAERADYLSDTTVSTEAKVKVVKNILSKVGQKARNDVRDEMGYEKKKVR